MLLCEGYHDRAFLTGWLQHLGCTDLGVMNASGAVRVPVDPWGQTVKGGQFALQTRSGRFVRIVPCKGKTNVLRTARLRLGKREQEQLTRLVLCVDPDNNPTDPADAQTGMRPEDVERFVHTFDPNTQRSDETSEFVLDGGKTRLALIRWEAPADVLPGVPNQQTLERLVCLSLHRAFPERGVWVQRWLDGRPAPTDAGSKAFVWSHMAGWYADHGCDYFFRHLWQEPPVAAQIETLLRQSGAWQVMEKFAY